MTKSYFIRADNSRWEVVGDLLASSSSYASYKPRWVEFDLYRSQTGTYVLARVGKSLLFHKKECKVVSRNNLKPVQETELEANAIPCSDCMPLRSGEGGVYPETPRYFALKTTTAKGVLAAVVQYDDNNSEYLTYVAKRLLMEAAEVDSNIHDVISERTIE